MSGLIKSAVAFCLIAFGSVSVNAASLTFDLQPITICDPGDPGTCKSTLDSNPAASLFDGGFLNAIFNQLDIAVNILPTLEYTSITIPRDVNGEVDSGTALNAFKVEQNSLGTSANTIYMGFTGEFIGSTLGLAFVDAPFSPFGVIQNTIGQNLVDDAYSIPPGAIELFPDTQPGVFFEKIGENLFQQVFIPDLQQDIRFQTVVLAHEIGHVLGAPHDDINDFVMSAVLNPFTLPDLPAFSVISELTILDSTILTAVVEVEPPVSQVPLPAPFALFLMALLSVLMTKARRWTVASVSGQRGQFAAAI